MSVSPRAATREGPVARVDGRANLVVTQDDAAVNTDVLEGPVTQPAFRTDVSSWGIARVQERDTNAAIVRRLGALCREVLA